MTDLAHDYLDLDSLLSAEEIELRDRVRAFVRERITPNIKRWYETAHFPREIATEMGALGLLGMHLDGYGCPGRSAVEYGLAAWSSRRATPACARSSASRGRWRCARSTVRFAGAEAAMAAGHGPGELIGCFGLTEPDAGSDPGGMVTSAGRDGDDWVLNGTKMWITWPPIADVAVIWAKTDQGIRGFVVPTDAPGFAAPQIEPKLGMRASIPVRSSWPASGCPPAPSCPGPWG